MDCGKSTLALQLAYTQSGHGRSGRLFTCHDRSGGATITSRLGLTADAVEVTEGFSFWSYVLDRLTRGQRIDFLVCDEAQFYTAAQIDDLARIVDEIHIDVFAFGILADFRTELFPGSKRLVELADRVETLQVQPLCWCGNRATHNARVIDGVMVTEGSQVAVGDIESKSDSQSNSKSDSNSDSNSTSDDQVPTPSAGSVSYEVLCRRHHRERITSARAAASPSPEVLPFAPVVESA